MSSCESVFLLCGEPPWGVDSSPCACYGALSSQVPCSRRSSCSSLQHLFDFSATPPMLLSNLQSSSGVQFTQQEKDSCEAWCGVGLTLMESSPLLQKENKGDAVDSEFVNPSKRNKRKPEAVETERSVFLQFGTGDSSFASSTFSLVAASVKPPKAEEETTQTANTHPQSCLCKTNLLNSSQAPAREAADTAAAVESEEQMPDQPFTPVSFRTNPRTHHNSSAAHTSEVPASVRWASDSTTSETQAPALTQSKASKEANEQVIVRIPLDYYAILRHQCRFGRLGPNLNRIRSSYFDTPTTPVPWG